MNTVCALLGLQLAVTAAGALAALLISGNIHAVLSAVIGGGIGFLSALAYVRGAFPGGEKNPAELLKAQYRAEALKLAFTVILFAIAFTLYKEVFTLPLLLTYIATLSVYWFALLLR
jgi:ATP synthase protein I